MIKQRFTVKRRYWKVYAYYDIIKDNLDELIDALNKAKFRTSYIASAYAILEDNKKNCGFTYTNLQTKTTIIGITRTTSAEQFVNSFTHELLHLCTHIAKAYDININSEEICYISGDIAQEMFRSCHKLMCDDCRNS